MKMILSSVLLMGSASGLGIRANVREQIQSGLTSVPGCRAPADDPTRDWSLGNDFEDHFRARGPYGNDNGNEWNHCISPDNNAKIGSVGPEFVSFRRTSNTLSFLGVRYWKGAQYLDTNVGTSDGHPGNQGWMLTGSASAGSVEGRGSDDAVFAQANWTKYSYPRSSWDEVGFPTGSFPAKANGPLDILGGGDPRVFVVNYARTMGTRFKGTESGLSCMALENQSPPVQDAACCEYIETARFCRWGSGKQKRLKTVELETNKGRRAKFGKPGSSDRCYTVTTSSTDAILSFFGTRKEGDFWSMGAYTGPRSLAPGCAGIDNVDPPPVPATVIFGEWINSPGHSKNRNQASETITFTESFSVSEGTTTTSQESFSRATADGFEVNGKFCLSTTVYGVTGSGCGGFSESTTVTSTEQSSASVSFDVGSISSNSTSITTGPSDCLSNNPDTTFCDLWRFIVFEVPEEHVAAIKAMDSDGLLKYENAETIPNGLGHGAVTRRAFTENNLWQPRRADNTGLKPVCPGTAYCADVHCQECIPGTFNEEVEEA